MNAILTMAYLSLEECVNWMNDDDHAEGVDHFLNIKTELKRSFTKYSCTISGESSYNTLDTQTALAAA